MKKLLKAQNFMNKMHDYEMKFFKKTLEFYPDLPKIKELLILDGHNKITHNIIY